MFCKDVNYFLPSWKEEFKEAKPFPHIVIDNLFDDKQLTQAVNEFPSSSEFSRHKWSRFSSNRENGKAGFSGGDLSKFPNLYKSLSFLNSKMFVSFLRELVDIPTLQADPTYRGGGLHEISTGGHLSAHLDFSKYNSLWRRANCLLYLNKDWKEEYGGHLELFDSKPSSGGKCIKRILPVFNRLVIFGTSTDSWHGHPKPLTCPPDMKRKSLATYYYSTEAGVDNTEHGTIF